VNRFSGPLDDWQSALSRVADLQRVRRRTILKVAYRGRPAKAAMSQTLKIDPQVNHAGLGQPRLPICTTSVSPPPPGGGNAAIIQVDVQRWWDCPPCLELQDGPREQRLQSSICTRMRVPAVPYMATYGGLKAFVLHFTA